MAAILADLIPLALVVALSPLSVIPAVLVLQTPRPRPTALAFTAGWLFGLAALTAVFVALGNALDGDRQPPGWAAWLRIVVGAGLIGFGVYRFLTRHRAAHQPRWMRALAAVTPPRAAATAVVLVAANPKVLFMCIAAGLAIGTDGPQARPALAVLCFALLAGSTVLLPTAAYAASGDRLRGPIDALGAWMERRHALLVAAILVVLGAMVLAKGLHAL